jgi:hypothetical protein
MERGEQGEGSQAGPCQNDPVEIDRLVRTAHRVGLEEVGDRADLKPVDIGQRSSRWRSIFTWTSPNGTPTGACGL